METLKVEQCDREALDEIDDALGFLMDNEREIVVQAFARHRIAERERNAAWLRDQDGFGEWQEAADALENESPSARITGDKGRENPAEGAPYGEGLIGRITELEHDNALLRRALAYAQGQQLRLMDERTRYQVALIRIAEVDEGGLAEYTPQAMVAQARQALAQNERTEDV